MGWLVASTYPTIHRSPRLRASSISRCMSWAAQARALPAVDDRDGKLAGLRVRDDDAARSTDDVDAIVGRHGGDDREATLQQQRQRPVQLSRIQARNRVQETQATGLLREAREGLHQLVGVVALQRPQVRAAPVAQGDFDRLELALRLHLTLLGEHYSIAPSARNCWRSFSTRLRLAPKS